MMSSAVISSVRFVLGLKTIWASNPQFKLKLLLCISTSVPTEGLYKRGCVILTKIQTEAASV